MNKEAIKRAIGHLNGYALILNNRFIPHLAVDDTIKELKECLK